MCVACALWCYQRHVKFADVAVWMRLLKVFIDRTRHALVVVV